MQKPAGSAGEASRVAHLGFNGANQGHQLFNLVTDGGEPGGRENVPVAERLEEAPEFIKAGPGSGQRSREVQASLGVIRGVGSIGAGNVSEDGYAGVGNLGSVIAVLTDFMLDIQAGFRHIMRQSKGEEQETTDIAHRAVSVVVGKGPRATPLR